MPEKPFATQVVGSYVPAVAVTGDVTYQQRTAVLAGARVEVTLAGVSRADAPALVLAKQTIETGGKQPPYPFRLTYDPAKIDPPTWASDGSFIGGTRSTEDGKRVTLKAADLGGLRRHAAALKADVLREQGG